MFIYTFGFALVLLVGCVAALASTIFDLKQRTRDMESWLSTASKSYETRFAKLESERTNTGSAKIAAELDDLRGALDAMRETHRKFAGKVWGRIGADHSEQARDVPPDRDTLRREFLPKPNNHGA